jgi:hypothetical protein
MPGIDKWPSPGSFTNDYGLSLGCAVSSRQRESGHDPGRVVLDLAVMLAVEVEADLCLGPTCRRVATITDDVEPVMVDASRRMEQVSLVLGAVGCPIVRTRPAPRACFGGLQSIVEGSICSLACSIPFTRSTSRAELEAVEHAGVAGAAQPRTPRSGTVDRRSTDRLHS